MLDHPLPPPVPVVLPDYLKQQGISSVDFIKIDVDGKDWEILNSLDTALDASPWKL